MTMGIDLICAENESLKRENAELKSLLEAAKKYREDEIVRLQKHVDDLQSGMYINCVYCGFRYGPADEVPSTMADALREHIEDCPKHPMSKLKQELERTKEALTVARKYRVGERRVEELARIASLASDPIEFNEARDEMSRTKKELIQMLDDAERRLNLEIVTRNLQINPMQVNPLPGLIDPDFPPQGFTPNRPEEYSRSSPKEGRVIGRSYTCHRCGGFHPMGPCENFPRR